MIYETSCTAVGVFAFFVAVVLGISFYLGSKAKLASGYYAAHGQIPWFVNGVAFAGDYLSAASFLGISSRVMNYKVAKYEIKSARWTKNKLVS